MQKKVTGLLVMPVLIILFSIGFISAIGSCSIVERSSCTSNIVMGVSSLTNAHGEFPDEGTYSYVLCCDFGEGNTTCKTIPSPNKIIGLSSATNAHAEIPTETTYPVDVCYEDLACMSTSGACPTTPPSNWYPLEMVSLSDYTDAHIGNISDYPTKICCGSPIYAPLPCDLTSAYWSLSKTSPTPIIEGDTALDGQDVFLIVDGTNCAGETISFEVLEHDAGGTTPVTTNPEPVVFGSNAVGTWSAEWFDDNPFPFLVDNPEYYFIATVVSYPSEKVESPDPKLEVTSESTVEYCSEIANCGSYDEEYCNTDLCDVAENGGDFCDGATCFCTWDNGECKTSYSSAGECGDGVINTGETCDGSDWGSITGCTDFDAFTTGGILSCDSSCQFDTSLCTGGTAGTCGDGVINTGETCDGIEWGPIIGCTDFDEFTSGAGTLSCDSSCQFDTSLCTGGTISGTCTVTQTVESECEEEPKGLFIYSWTGEWDGIIGGDAYATCIAGGDGETIECPAQVELPFFNFYNVIIALGLISLIYFFWIKKNKSSKKRKKK